MLWPGAAVGGRVGVASLVLQRAAGAWCPKVWVHGAEESIRWGVVAAGRTVFHWGRTRYCGCGGSSERKVLLVAGSPSRDGCLLGGGGVLS